MKSNNRTSETIVNIFIVSLVIVMIQLTMPSVASAQQDTAQQARLLWAIGNQMGAVHWAAYYNDAENTRIGLENIVQLLRSNACIDASSWEALLTRLKNGATPKSLFADINALEAPTYDPGSFGITRFACTCTQGIATPHVQPGDDEVSVGNAHDGRKSFNYVLAHDIQIPYGQDNWRWCRKCQALFYGGHAEGVCPKGGTHDRGPSYNYVLAHDTQIANGQDNWRWCRKCESLFYAANGAGACPAGGNHDQTGSFNYVLTHDTQIQNGQDNWRWCRKCQGLFYGGYDGGLCPASMAP